MERQPPGTEKPTGNLNVAVQRGKWLCRNVDEIAASMCVSPIASCIFSRVNWFSHPVQPTDVRCDKMFLLDP